MQNRVFNINTIEAVSCCNLEERMDDNYVVLCINRSKFFYECVLSHKIFKLIKEVDSLDDTSLDWRLNELNISKKAVNKVKLSGAGLHQVFVHTDVICYYPYLLMYYRHLSALSRKSLYQLGFSIDKYECYRRLTMPMNEALDLCRFINTINSQIIESMVNYSIERSRLVMLSSVGTAIQGSWVNDIGTSAAENLKEVITSYVDNRKLGHCIDNKCFLTNDWIIIFSAEPDVGIFDAEGVIRIIIEVKGSLDLAGAQSRYGEAKKTFIKQFHVNPKCYTIYVASCFTDTVLQCLEKDDSVNEWFDLQKILSDEIEAVNFLNRIFEIIEDMGGLIDSEFRKMLGADENNERISKQNTQ